MARMNFVKSAKKTHKCRVCGKEIEVGQPYKWTHPRYRGRVDACPTCEIPISMTSSSKMVAIWEEQKTVDRSDPDSIKSLAETARGVSEEYQQSCDNQREYFPDAEKA